MDASADRRRVGLLAIHSRYARAILAGTKTVEFRKRAMAPDIQDVLLYETAPTRAIIGEFRLETTVQDVPTELWEHFGEVGYIDRRDFFRYFGDASSGVAYRISSVRAFVSPVRLDEVDVPIAAPQSFIYVDGETGATIRRLGDRQRSMTMPYEFAAAGIVEF